jgi:hypothetical protein
MKNFHPALGGLCRGRLRRYGMPKATEQLKDEALFEGFEKIEEERIGTGKHEKFHKLMYNLKNI